MKYWQVNYLVVKDDGRVQRATIALEAKDEAGARAAADLQLKGKHKAYKIVNVSAF